MSLQNESKTQKRTIPHSLVFATEKSVGGDPSLQLVDNRPESAAHQNLQDLVNISSRTQQLMALQRMTIDPG